MMFRVSLHGPRLTASALDEPRWPAVYGLGSLLQVSPTHVLLVANRRVLGKAIVDFEDGADGFIFDRIEALDADGAIPLSRNEDMLHPETGVPLTIVQHLSTGGFVPLGARLPDGSPHRAAGTGYLLSCGVAHLADHSERHLTRAHAHSIVEIIQLRFDGTALSVTGRDRCETGHMPMGYGKIRHPLQNAIPDGEDLLAGLTVAPIDRSVECIPSTHPHGGGRYGRNFGSGLCRWRHDGTGWRPIHFTPITGPDMAGEPTLIRDRDGSLLMSVRGKGSDAPPGEMHKGHGIENTYEHFRVYRSADNGKTWEEVVHLPRQRCATPVVLNRTAGGRPYLTGNPFQTQAEADPRGRIIMCTRRRWHLCCWPLTDDRRGVGEPDRIVDAPVDLGPARPFLHEALPHDNVRCLDHPIGSVCRLADGRWRTMLCFRATDSAVNVCGAERAPNDGLYVEELEVADDGPAAPPWRFE